MRRHMPSEPPACQTGGRPTRVRRWGRTVKPKRDIMPLLVMGGLVLLFALGYLLFPAFNGAMHHNDCVASGATNC